MHALFAPRILLSSLFVVAAVHANRTFAQTCPTIPATQCCNPVGNSPDGADNPIVGSCPFVEAWVEPCLGIAGAGQVGCPGKPFSTIQCAIDAIDATGCASSSSPGIVHVNPGVYSPNTNAETLPILLKPFINIQGVGARRCVVRGVGLVTQQVFFPINGGGCSCGQKVPAEVLVDCKNLPFSDPYEVFVDGVTFQGGDVQVLIEGEIAGHVRVSNCVFDMLDVSDVGVAGPFFGVLMVHRFNLTGLNTYLDYPINLLNNTFIQGWTPDARTTFSGRPECVAVCDVNDPVCDGGGTPDSNPTLRGVGNPSLQNNLVRYAAGAPRHPFLGIDDSDTRAIIGTKTGPTNAFDPTMLSPLGQPDQVAGPTFSFCVARVDPVTHTTNGVPPVPAVNPEPATGGVDPAFVGEMLSSRGASILFTRDWRILADSVLVDRGSAPDALGVLQALNQTMYLEPALPGNGNGLPESAFDFDGEVYGNPRVLGAFPDIGFDEADIYAQAGYQNDSQCFDVFMFNCGAGSGIAASSEFVITPSGGTMRRLQVATPVSFTPPFGYGDTTTLLCGSGFDRAFTTQFGAEFPAIVPGLGLEWLRNSAPLMINTTQPAVLVPPVTPAYVPPHDIAAHAHTFGLLTIPLVKPPINFQSWFCQQIAWAPAVGSAALSNLQCSVSLHQ